MGTSTQFYIGPIVRVSKGLTVDHKTEKKVCPKCDKVRDGKFCTICGSEIITKTKIKNKTITCASEIVEHLDQDWDDFESVFSCIGDDSLLTANYQSKNVVIWDRDDAGEVVNLQNLLGIEAVTEMREKGKAMFDIFTENGVGYELYFGATVLVF